MPWQYPGILKLLLFLFNYFILEIIPIIYYCFIISYYDYYCYITLARIKCISLDEKIATGSLLHALCVFLWPKIASQGNMHNKHRAAPLNSNTKVVYIIKCTVLHIVHIDD